MKRPRDQVLFTRNTPLPQIQCRGTSTYGERERCKTRLALPHESGLCRACRGVS